MIGIVRRVHLVTALVLLLAGLTQSLAVAQGTVCARMHSPEQAVEQASGSESDPEDEGPRSVSSRHSHDPTSGADEPAAVAAPCAMTALPTKRGHPSPVTSAGRSLFADSPYRGSVHAQPLFHPPRLS